MELESKDCNRIFLTRALVGFSPIQELKVVTAKELSVVDVTDHSISLRRPYSKPFDWQTGQSIILEIAVADVSFQLNVQLAKRIGEIATFVIVDASKKWIQAIENVLNPASIGKYIRLVSPQFYAPEQNFKWWLHGPMETNLYIFGSKKKLNRLVFECNGKAFHFEAGVWSQGESPKQIRSATEDYSYRITNQTKWKTLEDTKTLNELHSLFRTINSSYPMVKTLLLESLFPVNCPLKEAG